MQKHNPANERIKRKYLVFLKDSQGQSEPSADAAAKALDRFETYTGYRDFKTFHFEQARAFKYHLTGQVSNRTGEKLSKATVHSTLAALKKFFQWLSGEPGYKSRFRYLDADYFNLSSKDVRVATAHRVKTFPTLEQVTHVITNMPKGSDLERRNLALVAFTLMTGARVGALASLKLKHIDLEAGKVFQDAREVDTKNSKTFDTWFCPVGKEIEQTFLNWVEYLQKEKLWGNNDPLFPKTDVIQGASLRFEENGLSKEHWKNTTAIRIIFKEAFAAAGLPYFNPHSLRKTLSHLGMTLCRGDAEAMKAWSQNIGHDKVLTTFFSYGAVEPERQGEIIRNLAKPQVTAETDVKELKELLRDAINVMGRGSIPAEASN